MQFEVKVLRGTESLTALQIDATDTADAVVQAQARGYSVVAVAPLRMRLALRRPRGTFPLTQFSQEFRALLQAGLAVVEALETLAENEQRPDIRRVLMRLVASLHEGRSLSSALQSLPDSFPALYVATVRASEKTGALPEALARYVAYQQQMEQVRRQVVSASIYPVLLIAVGGLVIVFLMAYVVPRFSRIYADVGHDLPLLSRLLLHWGQLLETHGTALLGALLAAALTVGYVMSRTESRQWLLQRIASIPAIGARLKLYYLARFYWALGMLLRGGMPVLAALQMVAGLLPAMLHAQMSLVIASIREGRPISQAMDEQGLTTPVASRMLRVGERTGQMGDMMDRVASFYDDETARWIERFTKLFEPLLMVFIGVVIGAIVVLMYLPIFELAGSLQ